MRFFMFLVSSGVARFPNPESRDVGYLPVLALLMTYQL